MILPFAFLAFAVAFSFALRLAEPRQGFLVVLERVRTTALGFVLIDPIRALRVIGLVGISRSALFSNSVGTSRLPSELDEVLPFANEAYLFGPVLLL